ncbi:two-component system regulatory protein YycI [Lacticaseibacillus pabuli]|uniref:Two-component system regulatory protein YycI n=1 Tax=Lacticaseibacillus pabuli TaxID=3025672 RepID=A0ABY7WUL1_9LACO|nr:two-component system regulatory protein YycI [Lacticaseibacillus sp. KACC 23028]WDF82734.1 two-component system regulatory protein YycI [Lacticaseibacillus sp. KACC 23028]
MDFRRIEGIFLIVFVILDIFLGWSMSQNQRVYLSASTSSTGPQIAQQIKRDDIALPKLNGKETQGHYDAAQTNTQLSANYQTVANTGDLKVNISSSNGYQVLSASLNSPLRLRRKGVVSQLKNYVENPNNVLFGKDYVYSPELSGNGSYVFVQQTAGKRIVMDERANLTLNVSEGRLTSYRQSYVGHMIPMDNQQALMSDKEAIYTLYQSNEIVDSSRVLWVKLGYTWLLTTKGSQVFTPTWSVGIESKNSKNVTIKRVNAITQAVMKTH